MRVECWLRRSSSATSTSRSVAIWSMNAPVPPAQLPFMRSSMPPVARVEKDDLGVLAAQFDHHIGVRRQRAHQFADHKDFLLKGQARGLGKSDARRTGDRRAQKAVRDQRLKIRKHLEYLLPRLRIVALITLIEDVSALHQRQFYRRGADIDPQRTDGLLLCLFHAKSRLCAGMAGKK